jgi:hypothetical protein
MNWLKQLLHPREPVRQSGPTDCAKAPLDWSDIAGWDRYLTAQVSHGPFGVPTAIGEPGWESVRFRNLVEKYGDRIWFPGCGIDRGPRFYAYAGCTVLATDFSPVAVGEQLRFAELTPAAMFTDWPAFVKIKGPFEKAGRFDVAEHDFTACVPGGVFDLAINCRAFQGLAPEAMAAAAGNFFASLRPGGAVVIDTMNVQGKARDVIEDSLSNAGFYLPFSASERWYRDQLESTGIVYGMVLGRPQIPSHGQHPAPRFEEHAERDRGILASFRTEYEARRAAEEASVKAALERPETIAAHVVYATG